MQCINIPDSFQLYVAFAFVVVACNVIELTMAEHDYNSKCISKRVVGRKKVITYLTTMVFIIVGMILMHSFY